LTLANRGDPPSGFDPMRTSSIGLHHVGGALFGPGNLVMRCRENMYMVCPYLATSWRVSADGREWTFKIRSDAQWHDGQPLTAEDIKFWLDLSRFGRELGSTNRAPAYFAGEIASIETVSVLDGNQIRITLNTRERFLPEILANPRLKIAHPSHLIEPLFNQDQSRVSPLDLGLVGAGPFSFEKYMRGSQIKVKRFDQYFERDSTNSAMPYLDEIHYVIMKDNAAMDAAFRTGRLDGAARGFGHYLTEDRKQGYLQSLGDQVAFAEIEGGMFRLAFNTLKPGPWSDPNVRRAIALWIDKRAAIPSVLGGFGWTAPELGPENKYKDKRFVVWPSFDNFPLPERRSAAKKLITEAGYEHGFVMDHLCRARHSHGCEYLNDQLRGLGIDLVLRLVDTATWNQKRVSLDFDTQQGRLSVLPIPEGTEGVYGRFSRSPDAYAKHEDQKVDELYRLLRRATTPDRRIGIWRQLQEYLFVDQTYIIPIAEAIYVVPYRTYVKGLIIPPEDGHTHTDFATVWIDNR
jgi:peptide/nickel transport system substrate-binding protein